MAFFFSLHLAAAKLVQEVYLTVPYFLLGSAIAELISGVVIVGVLQPLPWVKAWRDVPWLMLCGFLYGGTVNCVVAALAFSPAVEVVSLFYFNPILAAIIGSMVFRDKFGIPAVIGLIVFVVGVVVMEKPAIIFGGDDFHFTTNRKIGWSFAIAAAVLGGTVLNVIRGLGDKVASTVLPLFAYGAQITMVFPALFFFEPQPDDAPKGWIFLIPILIGGLAAALGEILFCRSAQLLSAGYASTLESTLIIWGTIWGWLFAHEAITWNVGVGCMVMISGIAAIGIDQNRQGSGIRVFVLVSFPGFCIQ